MSLFSNKPAAVHTDKNTPAYAVQRYNMARSNLLSAILFTILNIVLGCFGSGVYFLFSISFPYFMFDITDMMWSIPAIVILAVYAVFYILSKKKPGFMIATLVIFILDFLFLIVYSLIFINIPELDITFADFIIDYLTHIWVLVYLIIGTRYVIRYKAAINENPEILDGSVFKNASVPTELMPGETGEAVTEDDVYGGFTGDGSSGDQQQ